MQEDRYEKLKKQADDKDRKLDLIQHCTKISQGLDKMPVNAGDRAIWELVQNACDLSKQGKCHIKMTLTENEFVFSHKGEPFTYETLSSLIRQVSSSGKQIRQAEGDEQPTVGQYGTGFLTTHKFSRVIELKGSLDASLEGEPLCYVDLSDETGKGFTIDREFDNILSFVDKMSGQIANAQKLLGKETTPTEKEWTEFHYRLNEATYSTASKALAQARKLMPYVIAINPKIEEVEIQDTSMVTFKCLATKDENVDGYMVSVVEVGVTGEKNRKVYCLCSNDKKQIVIIPPTEFPPLDETPSLFLYYPLLGSENFGVNFIFHSASFEATELRDGIILPSENENTRRKYEQNVRELTEMATRLTGFLQKTKDCRFSIGANEQMARVFFPLKTDDGLLTDFYDKMRKLFVGAFEQLLLLETPEGAVSIASGKAKVIHHTMLEGLTAEQMESYRSVLERYAKMAYALPERNPIEWSMIIDEWGTEKDDYFVTCQAICEKIKEKSSDLLDFVNILNATEHQGMLNKYPIIPNRSGLLCTAERLKFGKTIGEDLYRIAAPLLGEKAGVLVEDTFKDTYPFEEYTRKMLRDDISNYLLNAKKDTIDEGKEFDEALVSALLEYCSYYSSAGGNSFRNRVMPMICQLYGREYQEKVIPPMETNVVDLYETPFGYLVDCAMIHISEQTDSWVQENEGLLYVFLKEYYQMKESKWTEKLVKYAVVPNQNNKLCHPASLRKNKDVDSDLIDCYEKVMNEDLRESLVSEKFQELTEFGECTAQEVAQTIQNNLENGKYQNRIVIDIIEKLEAGGWNGLFGAVYNQRESIRYNLGTDEEKRQINRLMKRNDEDLLRDLANVAENERAIDIIQLGWEALDKKKKEEHIKKLGEFVENNLYRYFKVRLNQDGIDIRDEQGGQDYIISKAGCENYRVEVKSRWSIDDSVEMSTLQVATAVAHPTRFALVMVNMHKFDEDRIDREENLSDAEIEDLVKVADNIGELASELYGTVDGIFKMDGDIKAEGAYSFRVKQTVFKDRNLNILGLIEIIKKAFV